MSNTPGFQKMCYSVKSGTGLFVLRMYSAFVMIEELKEQSTNIFFFFYFKKGRMSYRRTLKN